MSTPGHISFLEYLSSHALEDVIALLESGGNTWMYRYELLDQGNNYIADIDVSQCTISYDALAQVNRTITFNMREQESFAVNFQLNRIRPLACVLGVGQANWIDFSMGVFIMNAPQTYLGDAVAKGRAVTGSDLGLVLTDDKTTNAVSVVQGADVIQTVTDILAGANLPSVFVPTDTTYALPTALEWDIGTAKYTLIDQLLSAINFESLYFDVNGNPTAIPYQSPATAPILATYSVVPGAPGNVIVAGSMSEELAIGEIPNVIVGLASSPDLDANGNAINWRASYENDSPQSPISTVNINRQIVSVVNMTGIVSQVALQQAVQQQAETEALQYAQITFQTAQMPIHNNLDVLLIDDGTGIGPVRYRETQWSFQMKAGSPMSHTARRAVRLA